MSAYFDRPPLQIGAQRASISSSSFSSSSSHSFDRRSKVSQFTDLTPLITPADSLDSIFGNNPELQPVPRFPDLFTWDGLTDEQWKPHPQFYEAERAIEEAAKGILTDFENFLQEEIWYDDNLHRPDDEFDAVTAVRAKLAEGEQTTMSRRALDIMDSRSGVAPTSIDDTNSGGVEHSTEEEIDDYTETFNVGGDEVLDIPATPHNGSIHSRRSFLEAIEEVDESREPDSLFNVTFPSPFLFETDNFVVSPTPPTQPMDAIGSRLSFPTSYTGTSTPKLISQLMMSPLSLNDPDITSSPAIFRNSFRNIDPRSPIVSSVLFSSRRPLPTSLLNESLDEVAARLRISDIDDVNPWAGIEFTQENGLGLFGVPTRKDRTHQESSSSCVAYISESPEYEFQTSHLDRPNYTKVMNTGVVGGTSSESSSEVDLPNFRYPQPRCSEPVSPFEPAQSPWDILLEGLGQSITPYVPTLDYTIAYTGPATSIGFDGESTVTSGSSHPAASSSFITSINEANDAGKGARGLGLGLPMGDEQERVSGGLPPSEACLDLASLAARLVETDTSDSLGDFRGHVLSPIAEEPTAQPDLCPTFSEPPSPKKRKTNYKRILRCVLPTFSIRRRY